VLLGRVQPPSDLACEFKVELGERGVSFSVSDLLRDARGSNEPLRVYVYHTDAFSRKLSFLQLRIGYMKSRRGRKTLGFPLSSSANYITADLPRKILLRGRKEVGAKMGTKHAGPCAPAAPRAFFSSHFTADIYNNELCGGRW
jgi:hypothetical protein